jgi:hypothetical protein
MEMELRVMAPVSERQRAALAQRRRRVRIDAQQPHAVGQRPALAHGLENLGHGDRTEEIQCCRAGRGLNGKTLNALHDVLPVRYESTMRLTRHASRGEPVTMS